MGMKRFIALILTVLSLVAYPALASEVRPTTDLITDHLSGPDVDDKKNIYIFTAPGMGSDGKIYSQVFYQWVDSTTTAADTSPQVQITDNPFHAKKAKFGPTIAMAYFDTFPPTIGANCKGITFFYLADANTNSRDELHMGCLDESSLYIETPSTLVVFETTLTGYSPITDFDIKDYDVPKLDRAPTLMRFSTPSETESIPVVFTDTRNKLHMLMFNASEIAGDATNITHLPAHIVYDYTDGHGLFVWNATTINTGKQYFEPKFDAWGSNVVYSVLESASTYKQLGMINIAGRNQYTITDLARNVIHPDFHGDAFPSSDFTWRMGVNVFFELEENTSRKSQLVYLPVMTTIFGPFMYCNTPAFLTDGTHNASGLVTSYGTYRVPFPPTHLLYLQEQDDGNRDVMRSSVDLISTTSGFYCDGSLTRSDGRTISMISASSGIQSNLYYDLTTSVGNTKQLTCSDDNTSAQFLPQSYHDLGFNEMFPTTPQKLLDVVFKRDHSDGSGRNLGHIYNTLTNTHECHETCFETKDGSPVEDINGFRDGDGRADWCEDPTCKQLVDADWTGGDADTDGVFNYRDNCPCDSNPGQEDEDNDHWGDVCDVEFDECGTTDTDGDSTGDLCDECDEDADYTDLPFDNDGDDIPDSCISINPCGETDSDDDGTFDDCDACPSDKTLTAFAYDLDGDSVMDSCLASPCGTVDSDQDGVFDNCDACPNDPGAVDLTFDVNADGLVDSCETIPTVEPQQDTTLLSGGIQVGGSLLDGLFSCSLNTQVTASTHRTSQTGMWLSLLLGIGALVTQTRHKAKQRQK